MTNTNSFGNIIANNLDDVKMYAGDEQLFVYTIYDANGGLYDLLSTTCTVKIFKMSDPENLLYTISGSIIMPASSGQFSGSLTSSQTSDWSGIYVHQPVITDSTGSVHIPAQGRIVVFPSPQ